MKCFEKKLTISFLFSGGYTTGGPRDTAPYYTESGAAAAPAPAAASPLDEYYPPEYPPAPSAPPAQPYLDDYYHHAHAHTQPLLPHEPKYQPHAYSKPYPRGEHTMFSDLSFIFFLFPTLIPLYLFIYPIDLSFIST
jgi:hypothetical protein